MVVSCAKLIDIVAAVCTTDLLLGRFKLMPAFDQRQ